ncbi:hypothetical protein B0T20DRAFT_488429 [Sordaria brevicollis]|uniref:Myb-like DNA-binding domain-containing protein n=1 Tax=Sordaria brevicollis TaxID=83679 RepID=A0AAE0P3A8_SORBR|nr:hypothetical protein B0T20DRAFT_488429 [Sordaria brevicollis]
MPPKANQDVQGQMNFLLTCIKHSNNGKINWTDVAEELGIVSKAAAAKRYERLLKSHDIQPPKNYGSLSDDPPVSSPVAATPKGPKGTPAKTPRTAKRKRAAAINYNEDSDKEDGEGGSKPFTFKAEPESSDEEEEKRPVKKEKKSPTPEVKSEDKTEDKTEVKPKTEPADDGESDYFSCFSDDIDLLVIEEDGEPKYTMNRWEAKEYDMLMECCW